MKTIGLIGGMSWESTVTYYKLINEGVRELLGGFHSARLLMYSVDFSEIERCQAAGEWEKSGDILAEAAKRLEAAGADFILICTNTMHKVAPQVQRSLNIPLLHIADAAADALIKSGIAKTALLGTKYTMTQDFYRSRLVQRGISVVVPNAQEIEEVNRVIYDELVLGVISEESRSGFGKIIARLKEEEGAQAVILGCTEIGLLIRPQDSALPVFDTTCIHAQAAVQRAVCE